MKDLNSAGRAAFTSGLVLCVLAGLAVGLRLLTKSFVRAGFSVDDAWIVVALLSFYVSEAVLMWGLFDGGGGKDVKELVFQFPKLATYLKSLYISFVFYFVTVTAVKISILCFYRRIFSTPSFRRMSLMVGVVAVSWYLVVELVDIFICWPVERFWTPLFPGRCLDFNAFFLAIGITETIIDTAILLLPIRIISTLRLPRRDRIVLSAIFLLGGFVVITGVVRLAFVYQPNGAYVSFRKAELWLNIHTGTGIICACLPIYRPLLAKAAVISENLQKRYGSLFGSRKSSTPSSDYDISLEGYGHVHGSRHEQAHRPDIEAGARPGDPVGREDHLANSIAVS